MAVNANTVVNFYGTTDTVTTVTANNVNSTATGTLVADLIDVNSANTGVSLSCSQGSRTANDVNGRNAGATTLAQQINDGGIFRNVGGVGGTHEYVLTFPASHPAVDIDIFVCTTFSSQANLNVQAVGSTTKGQNNWDSTNNTTGAFVAVTNIAPDGSNQIIIRVTQNVTNNFVYINGFVIKPIISNIEGTVATTFGQLQSSSNVDVTVHATVATTFGVLLSSIAAGTIEGTIATTFDQLQSSSNVEVTTQASLATTFGQLQSSINVDSGTGQFTDFFDGDGALDGWDNFNPSAVPNAARVSGQYNSGSISAVGSTTWFNSSRGRADWKLQTFPVSGTNEYVFKNVGVGPSASPADNLTYYPTGNQFAFCGVIVHDESLTDADYEFIVVGHRGNTQRATVENKRTTADVSTVTHEGADAIGTGVTHCDMRLRLHDDNTIDWAYRAVGDTLWTQIQAATGHPGKPTTGNKTWTSSNVYIGLITYAFSAVPEAFRGTADSAELVGELDADGTIATTFGELQSDIQVDSGESTQATVTTTFSTLLSDTVVEVTTQSTITTTFGELGSLLDTQVTTQASVATSFSSLLSSSNVDVGQADQEGTIATTFSVLQSSTIVEVTTLGQLATTFEVLQSSFSQQQLPSVNLVASFDFSDINLTATF